MLPGKLNRLPGQPLADTCLRQGLLSFVLIFETGFHRPFDGLSEAIAASVSPGDQTLDRAANLVEPFPNIGCVLPVQLEHFDGIGTFRSVSEAGAPVDAKGAFPTGEEFEGLGGLRSFILGHREAFVETFIEKLLAYALGRELEVFDLPTVRQIQQQAASTDYRWSSIVTGIVTSTPFGMRTARDTEEARVAGSTPSAGGAVR